jgi:hypothetical protein
MATNKKIFIIVALVFIATMIFFTIDIFSRTTRRGAKKHLIESVKPKESFSLPPHNANLSAGILRSDRASYI